MSGDPTIGADNRTIDELIDEMEAAWKRRMQATDDYILAERRLSAAKARHRANSQGAPGESTESAPIARHRNECSCVECQAFS